MDHAIFPTTTPAMPTGESKCVSPTAAENASPQSLPVKFYAQHIGVKRNIRQFLLSNLQEFCLSDNDRMSVTYINVSSI